MNKFRKAREEYDNISIPEELHERVEQTIAMCRAVKENNEASHVFEQKHKMKWKNFGMGAAAAFAVFVAGINVNTTLAAELEDVPVIGGVVRVFTIKSYADQDEIKNISAEIPQIEANMADTEAAELKSDVEDINTQIEELCERYQADAEKYAEEYKEAFISTGGTEEEWKEHNVDIKVWYEVKSQTEEYLSLMIGGNMDWMSCGTETVFYNIKRDTGKDVSLEDLLGSDYQQIADDEIRNQMSSREADGDVFWTEEQGGFAGISQDTKFYMNEEGNPVVIFDKYEVGPGSMGQVEFEISR